MKSTDQKETFRKTLEAIKDSPFKILFLNKEEYEKDDQWIELVKEAALKDFSTIGVLTEKSKLVFESLESNKKLMKELCDIDGDFLQYAPEEIKDDEEVVKVAVNNKAMSFRFASEKLRRNWDLFDATVKSQENTLDHLWNEKIKGLFSTSIPEDCVSDIEWVKHVARGYPQVIESVTPGFLTENSTLIATISTKQPRFIACLPDSHKLNVDWIGKVATLNPEVILELPEIFVAESTMVENMIKDKVTLKKITGSTAIKSLKDNRNLQLKILGLTKKISVFMKLNNEFREDKDSTHKKSIIN
ncbi:MAG: DUF4116 domain-containing protein [Pseudomonadota bacterium]|nr:DUF4116 domain-containing protein [Pseudomonadota bacterium]